MNPSFPRQPFTTGQAYALDVTRGMLRRALADHTIRRVVRGVYVRAEIQDSQQLRLAAARLVIGASSVARDRTAAWLLDVDVMDYDELDNLPPLETCVLPDHHPTVRPECDGRTRDLLPEDIVLLDDVPVTSPLRTAMDLGCNLGRRRAMAAIDAFRRKYGITKTDMEGMLPRYFRRRGVVQLRQLIPLSTDEAESTGESWTRIEIVDAGLPTPKPQHWIYIDGVPTFRLENAYPQQKVAVEYDGQEFHGPEQKEYDRLRREWLRNHGWIIIVVDKNSFTFEAICAWTAELREALAR